MASTAGKKRQPVPRVEIGPGARPGVHPVEQLTEPGPALAARQDQLPPPLLGGGGDRDTVTGEILPDTDEVPRDWYCTFMPAAWIQLGGQIVPLLHRYVRVHGTYEEVRQRMTALFPGLWEFQHRSAVTAGVDARGLVEFDLADIEGRQ